MHTCLAHQRHNRKISRLIFVIAAISTGMLSKVGQAEFLPLGDLPGSSFLSTAYGVNADGTVVTGYSQSANGREAYRWTQAGGMVGLGDLPGGTFSSTAYDVSADGSVVVGWGGGANGVEAFRWSQSGGMVGLGDLPGGSVQSMAYRVNADGAVVVGESRSANGREAFRWTQSSGMVGLGDLPGGAFQSIAYGVNADGSVVVGQGQTLNGTEAFRWTQTGGMVGLGDLPGGAYNSVAYVVNNDGTVVVGYSNSANGAEAFRWTQSGGMVGLGDLPGGSFSSIAYAVSADGKVVLGNGNSNNGMEAFRWSQDAGMQTLTQWLIDAGVSIAPGFTLQTARGISDDGSVVIGFGPNADGNPETFLARVDVDAGSGVISLNDLSESLVGTGDSNQLALATGDLILNGAHSRPLSRRVNQGQKCAWVAGDWGESRHDSRDGELGLAEIGGCHNFGWSQASLSVGKTWADQNLDQNGDIDIDSYYLVAEMMFPLKSDLWGSVAAVYQTGEADIRRGYLNAGLPDRSSGSPDIEYWAVRARLDWESAIQLSSASISPYADISYRENRQDSYTETGGAFPARFDSNTADATELRLGVNAKNPINSNTRLLGQLEGVHRFDDDGVGVSGNVVGLFGFDYSGSDTEQDWLRGGVGMEHETSSGKFSVMLNGTTRGEEASAWLAASYHAVF